MQDTETFTAVLSEVCIQWILNVYRNRQLSINRPNINTKHNNKKLLSNIASINFNKARGKNQTLGVRRKSYLKVGCLYNMFIFPGLFLEHRQTQIHTSAVNSLQSHTQYKYQVFFLDSMQFLKGTMSNFIKLTSLQLSLYFSTQLKVWPYGSGCQHHGSW